MQRATMWCIDKEKANPDIVRCWPQEGHGVVQTGGGGICPFTREEGAQAEERKKALRPREAETIRDG